MRRNIYDRLSERREREERLERERLEEEARNTEPPPPKRFLTNELSFVRPENLKEKTFHLLALTDSGPSPFSLVVGRSLVEPGAELEAMAQELLREMEGTLSHLQWVEPISPVELTGLEARRMEFRWRQQGQPIHQIQFIFLCEDEFKRPLLMQVTGTSNNPKGMTGPEREVLSQMIGGLKLRKSEPEEGGNKAVSV
ncbi:MAG TPA: cytoplasmic protein [Pseudomonas sp.]|nr:cytoplasmic protein [Pseudomonas sp.]